MTHKNHYGLLSLMFLLHVVAMYVLMYAMVNSFANVYPNHNQFYMALLMAAPMLILEVLLMHSMYQNRKLNLLFLSLGVLILAGSFLFIRQQAAIADEQFLKSMIPHHAGAVLMCNEASLVDDQIKELCANIITGQQAEIEWMKAKLAELENN